MDILFNSSVGAFGTIAKGLVLGTSVNNFIVPGFKLYYASIELIAEGLQGTYSYELGLRLNNYARAMIVLGTSIANVGFGAFDLISASLQLNTSLLNANAKLSSLPSNIYSAGGVTYCSFHKKGDEI